MGPANALLDAVTQRFTGAPYDADGALAARGEPIPELLERLLADPYYARRAPKSTGKEHFNLAYLGDLSAYAVEDVLATLVRLTVTTVADAARGATEVIVSGGGTRNATLMRSLRAVLPVTTSDALGLRAQDKEAYAFALLGFLTHHGRAGTIAAATGARHASVLGALTPGSATAPAPRALRIA